MDDMWASLRRTSTWVLSAVAALAVLVPAGITTTAPVETPAVTLAANAAAASIRPAGPVLDFDVSADNGRRVLTWNPPKPAQLGGGELVAYRVRATSSAGTFTVRVTKPTYTDRRNYCLPVKYTVRAITRPPGGGPEVLGEPYVSRGDGSYISPAGECFPTPRIVSATAGSTSATIRITCVRESSYTRSTGHIDLIFNETEKWSGTCRTGATKTVRVTGLTPGTTYTVAPGKVIGNGTSYGDSVTVTTTGG